MRRPYEVICLPTLASLLIVAPIEAPASSFEASSPTMGFHSYDSCWQGLLGDSGDRIDMNGLSFQEWQKVVKAHYDPQDLHRNVSRLRQDLYALCAIDEGECIGPGGCWGQCDHGGDAPDGMTENRLREIQQSYLCRPRAVGVDPSMPGSSRDVPAGSSRWFAVAASAEDVDEPSPRDSRPRLHSSAFQTEISRLRESQQYLVAEVSRLRETLSLVFERARKKFPGVNERTAVRRLLNHMDALEVQCCRQSDWRPLAKKVREDTLGTLASLQVGFDPDAVIRVLTYGKDSDRSRVARDLRQLLREADFTVRDLDVVSPPAISWVVHPDSVELAAELAEALSGFLDVGFLVLEDQWMSRSEIQVLVQGRPRFEADGSVVYEDPYGFGPWFDTTTPSP